MKKAIISFSLIIIHIMLFLVNASAKAESWYMKKNQNSAPTFPKSSDYALNHSCYAMDFDAYKKGEKKLYLTFDCGYENGNITKILDILKEKDVRGSFFILKNMVLNETELLKRMVDDGHIVANHTKNHKDMTTLTDDEMRLNLKYLEDLYFEKTGNIMPKLFRYPEGKYNNRTVDNAERLGYKTFFWSLAYPDWDNNDQPREDWAFKQLIDYTHSGAIVLLHPTSETNAKIIGKLIDKWREMGYTFDTVNNIK